MSIPTVTLAVTINTFRPIGSVYPIDATFALTAGDPRIFKFDGETLLITLPTSQPVQIIYQLSDPRYVLLGIAFTPPKSGGVGRVEFPTITLNRNPEWSQMFVVDAAHRKLSGIDYPYVVLVQEVASGAIGLIDPDIETDIEN